MADGTTPNLGLVKPEFDGSVDTWGTKINSNFDVIDQAIQDLRIRGTYQGAELGTFLSATEEIATPNAWTPYVWTTTIFDQDPPIISAEGANFQSAVGPAIEWDIMLTVMQDDVNAYYPASQQIYADVRLYNVTDATVASRGFRGSHSHTYLQSKYGVTSGMQGAANVHCVGGARLTGGKLYRLEMYVAKPNNSTKWYRKFIPNTAGLSDELVGRMKFWRI